MLRGLEAVRKDAHVDSQSAQERLTGVHCLLDVTSLIHRRGRVGSSVVPLLPTQHS